MESQKLNPQIEESWKNNLTNEFSQPYFYSLKQFLVEEKKQYTLYPPGSQIFAAFDKTPYDSVKVVILGQDPYHGKGQAHGLCFSVPPGIKAPPSLVNIFKEIQNDLGIPIPSHGNLSAWTSQGILLLNATLTVRANQPGSHQNKGWETFTNSVIKNLSDHSEGLVFLLWGKFAQAKEELIDSARHHVLKAAHPSPYSANAGFFGCRHFSKTNQILKEQGKDEINWSLI
ncbi:MAG: uracil-DNA glycosylase [Bacteroidales bacterium]|nr:uracil-DNA glycosylase [Bacteroidales bacterium]